MIVNEVGLNERLENALPNPEEQQYQYLLTHILKQGQDQIDRTGVGTRKVFDSRLEFDLSEGHIPLFTTKYTNLHGIDKELDWFLTGNRNVRDLIARGCNIWSNWIKPYTNFMDCRWVDRPYIRHECDVENHEHYHRLENGACVIAIDEEVMGEIQEAIDNLALNSDSSYWKRQMEFRHRRSMQRNDPTVDRLFRLWMMQLTVHTIPSLIKPSPDHNGEMLCQRWLEFEHFFEDVQQLPNYSRFVDSEDDGSVRLTGIYDLDPVLRPETAVFMSDEEYQLYKEQEQEGLWKATFNAEKTGRKAPPQYYLQFEDVKQPSVRILDELHEHVNHIERVSMQGKSWRLRMAKSKGDLGPVYGFQWRNFNGEGYDQIAKTVHGLKNSPYSRRHVVSCWNPAQLAEMQLEPCHYSFQFNVSKADPDEADLWRRYHTDKEGVGDTAAPEYKLDLKFHMRSIDSFLGLPFNIASYALLLIKMAGCAKMQPGRLIFDGGDTHIYFNHFDQVREQIGRVPYAFPTYSIENWGALDPQAVDVTVSDYDHHPAIRAPIAV